MTPIMEKKGNIFIKKDTQVTGSNNIMYSSFLATREL